MSRIVVTGIAGFIGSNLAERLLRSGHEVVGVDNFSYGVREQVPNNVEMHEMDIRDPALVVPFRGADAIFHLAAKNCIADCQSAPLETTQINVEGTVNVFEAARRAGIRRIIHAESSALYEGCVSLPSREDNISPESVYAVSKASAGAFAQTYERYHKMQVTALRYFGVYGPRQDYRRTIPPLMSALIIKLLRGEQPIIYGNGEKRRDFVFVDDVNDFHLTCLSDHRTIGGTFNLGYGESYSVNEIFERISKLLNTTIRPLYMPNIEAEAATTHADISRAVALGWSPKVPLIEGLRRSIAYVESYVKGTK